ncbi:type I-A CRISPR-associated protein Csa5 [Metallosphaera tengchongensis]|uniref:Type I-A CRISPR-associated protein Csa5 n=1 Tax=Metallosphaera tengchongensis TaxID=1532350 RepID=A0A6N0NW74_9CREN|nr:type I-A CRISPR-associated protein Csa5 [Metallosphaera tengchongensis]
MSQEDKELVLRRVANLLAVATIYADTPTFTDRMANALNKESVLRSIYDAERIVKVGKDRGEIMETREQGEHSGPWISVVETSDKGKNVKGKVFGYLPSEQDVEKFLNYVEKDIYLARKVGALAMAAVNKQG